MLRVLFALSRGVRLGRINTGTILRRVTGDAPRYDEQLGHYVSHAEPTVETAPIAVKAARQFGSEDRASRRD
jgi:hypothetical protein